MTENITERYKIIKKNQAARSLEFERAAELSDELSRLKKLLPAGAKE